MSCLQPESVVLPFLHVRNLQCPLYTQTTKSINVPECQHSIVEFGYGDGGGAWIALHPDWFEWMASRLLLSSQIDSHRPTSRPKSVNRVQGTLTDQDRMANSKWMRSLDLRRQPLLFTMPSGPRMFQTESDQRESTLTHPPWRWKHHDNRPQSSHFSHRTNPTSRRNPSRHHSGRVSGHSSCPP